MITKERELDKLPLHISNKYFSSKITPWYQEQKQSYPWRAMWDKYKNPYHVWVSEIMLQQTVIKAVIPKYNEFVKAFPKVQDFAKASEDDIRPRISGLGYYRRFRFLHNAAKLLLETSSGAEVIWPKTFLEWKALPGVGDYTAAAISSIAFNDPVPVVDGNVERVMCRFFDIRLPPNLPRLKKQFFNILSDYVDKKFPGDFNQGIMEIGQQVCLIGRPLCDQCPIKRKCLSRKNSSQHLAPAPKQKKAFKSIELALVGRYNRQGQIVLTKRMENSKFLKGVFGFETFIKNDEGFYSLDGSSKILRENNYDFLSEFKHTITNHKIQVRVYMKSFSKVGASEEKKLVYFDDVDHALTSSLDKKAWDKIRSNLLL